MSKTNKSKDSKTKLECLINGADWAAIVVVTIATIALIFVVSSLVGKQPENHAPKEIIIKYEIVMDSISLKKDKDSASLKTLKNLDENNKKILNEIAFSVDAQYKRMESILLVQEDRSKLFSYGGGFLAILVAIATFFGFKSINEMKKSTIEAAEYEARKIAEEKAKEVAQRVAEEKTKEELAKKLEDIKTELQSSFTSDFQGKIDERELNVSDEFLISIRQEFDIKINELREELNSLNYNTTPEPSDENETETEIIDDFADEGNPQSNDESLYNDNDLNN